VLIQTKSQDMIKTLKREAMHQTNNKYKEKRKNYCRYV